MKTLDGTPITVGMKVFMLITPVVKKHTFDVGTVIAVGGKQVHVETTREIRWYNNTHETVQHIVKRYPEQLIAKKED